MENPHNLIYSVVIQISVCLGPFMAHRMQKYTYFKIYGYLKFRCCMIARQYQTVGLKLEPHYAYKCCAYEKKVLDKLEDNTAVV